MPLKTVSYKGFMQSEHCFVLRSSDFRGYKSIEISFPFLEDTPNIALSASEAMSLRNAIDELLAIKLLEKTRSEG